MIRLVVILWLLPAGAFAQYSFYGGISYGTFSMESMKSLQQEIQSSPLNQYTLKAVATFPPYFGWSGGVLLSRSEKTTYGIGIDFNSTGGRLSYGDYSGYVIVDQILTAYSIGILGKFRVNKSTVWPLYIGMQASWVFSDLEFTSEGALGTNPPSIESTELSSSNIGFRASVGIQRNLPGGLFAFAQVGYEVQYHMNLKTSSGGETSLKAEWNGLRGLIGIGYTFRNTTKE